MLAAAALGVQLLAGDSEGAAGSGSGANVIVVLTDDQPFRSAELMPFLSRSGWAEFDSSVVNNPLCCPSRATILTGLNSHRTGVETNFDGQLLDDSDTVATWLDEAGYDTAFIGKYLNEYPWDKGQRYVPPGWDRWTALRNEPGYYGYELNIDGKLRNAGGRERDYLGRFLQRQTGTFLRDAGQEEPFFLMVSSYAPHGPAEPDPRDRGRARKRQIELPPNFNERDLSDKPSWLQENQERVPRREAVAEIRDRAAATVSVDRLLRSMVKRLRSSGELDETTIIYLSDHGYAVGEHRFVSKDCSYEECIRIPLRIRTPGVPADSTFSEPVSNADLAPTIADLAGVEPPDGLDGESLLPLMRGERPDGDRTILLRNALAPDTPGAPDSVITPEFWGARSRDYKYIEIEGGERELYDLRRDPYELENRADDPKYREIQTKLKREMEELRARGGPDSAALGDGGG